MPKGWQTTDNFQRLAPDPLDHSPSYQDLRDERQFVVKGKMTFRGALIDTGELWINVVVFSAKSNRLYIVTGRGPVKALMFSGRAGKSYLDVFEATTGGRIGSRLYLGWGDVEANVRNIQTFDNERILFVRGDSIPDVAIYLPGEWPNVG
jgi:hypothetical protein